MQTISQNAITQRKHGSYNAVDIGPYPDPYYYAPEDGTVTNWGESGTCGLRLVMDGPSGRHAFCHNESSLVKIGDRVKRGQRLAKMGYTGLTDPDDVPAGTHVHWVILRNGVYVYPPSLITESFIKSDATQGVNKMVDGNLINELFVGILFRLPYAEEVKRYDGKIDSWSLAHELNSSKERQELLARLHNAGGISQAKLDKIKKIIEER